MPGLVLGKTIERIVSLCHSLGILYHPFFSVVLLYSPKTPVSKYNKGLVAEYIAARDDRRVSVKR